VVNIMYHEWRRLNARAKAAIGKACADPSLTVRLFS